MRASAAREASLDSVTAQLIPSNKSPRFGLIPPEPKSITSHDHPERTRRCPRHLRRRQTLRHPPPRARTAVEFLIDKGYDPNYGARPMRRAVEKYLEDPLAEELLRGKIKAGNVLHGSAPV